MFKHYRKRVARAERIVGDRRFGSPRPELVKVTERVYSGCGYARANVLFVLTDKSVVVIDTTESPAAARECFAAFRNVSQLPVSYIVYTHFHGDHIRGATVFHTPTTRIVAQKQLPEEVAKVALLLRYNARVTALQFGLDLGKRNRRVPPMTASMHRAMFIHPLTENGYLAPDITFDEQYCFEEGGVSFELYHMPGESNDQLAVWLPKEKVLFPGDLFYQSFPMLSSPMKPDRPVLAWAESLERMRAFGAAYLVPSHNSPIRGTETIDVVLANYLSAIRYVHDETVKGINDGLTLEEIRQQVQLPEELARLPYLQQIYGSVEWAINGIFRQYTGWYTFNPADLRPGQRAVLQRAILDASGGAEPLIRRARRALRARHNQLALELTDVVLGAEPSNRLARGIRLTALNRLGTTATNGVERNIYLTAAWKVGHSYSQG